MVVPLPFYVQAGLRILPTGLELLLVYVFCLHEHLSGQMTHEVDRTCGGVVQAIKVGNVLVGTLASQLVTIVLLSACNDVNMIMVLVVMVVVNLALLLVAVPRIVAFLGTSRLRRTLLPVSALVCVTALVFYEELITALILRI